MFKITTLIFSFAGKLEFQEVIRPHPPPRCRHTGDHRAPKSGRHTAYVSQRLQEFKGEKRKVLFKFITSFRSTKHTKVL